MGTVLTVRRAGWVVDQSIDGGAILTITGGANWSKIQAVSRAKDIAASCDGATINIETVKGRFKETITLEAIDKPPDDDAVVDAVEQKAAKFGFGGK